MTMPPLCRTLALLMLAIAALVMSGCERKPESPLTLAASSWAGHSPLLYLEATGQLKAHNIRIVHVTHTSEALARMERGEIDGMAGTGYEYARLADKAETVPVILLNRSNGAEAILSNRTAEQLTQSSGPIAAYVETGSAYEMMVDTFVAHHGIDTARILKRELNILPFTEQELAREPLVVMAFEPFLGGLQAKGYTPLASSADTPYLMIEALLVTKKAADAYDGSLEMLDRLLLGAIAAFERDPEHYYAKILPYLHNQSFEDFKKNAHNISWIKEAPDDRVLQTLKARGMPIGSLIRRPSD